MPQHLMRTKRTKDDIMKSIEEAVEKHFGSEQEATG